MKEFTPEYVSYGSSLRHDAAKGVPRKAPPVSFALLKCHVVPNLYVFVQAPDLPKK